MSQRTITADDLAQVLADHPKLTAYGYDHPDDRQPDKREQGRQRITNALGEVQAAYDWILTLRRERISRDTSTSYTLRPQR